MTTPGPSPSLHRLGLGLRRRRGQPRQTGGVVLDGVGVRRPTLRRGRRDTQMRLGVDLRAGQRIGLGQDDERRRPVRAVVEQRQPRRPLDEGVALCSDTTRTNAQIVSVSDLVAST